MSQYSYHTPPSSVQRPSQHYPPRTQRAALKRPRQLSPPSSSSGNTSSSHTRSVRWKPTNHRRLYDPRELPGAYEEEGEEDDLLGVDGERESEAEDEGPPGEKVLALHAPNGASIAAASYDSKKKILHVLEDTKDTNEWDLAILLLEQWTPDLVIMSSKTQDSVLDKVEAWCKCKQEERKFLILPSKTFQHAQAIHTLSTLRLSGNSSALLVDPDTSNEERSNDGSDHAEDRSSVGRQQEYMAEHAGMGKVRLNLVKLGCWVNVDAPKAVCAAGGLLSYLMTKDSEDSFTKVAEVEVDRIEAMPLEQHMLINSDALTSLAIFSEQSRASAQAPKPKEGLSIYSLLRTTVTPLGHKLLHTWHLRPLVDLAQINARHDAVDVFSRAMNRETVEMVTKAMKRIKNTPIHLKRLRRGRGGYKEWRALLDAIWAAGVVKEAVCGIQGAQELEIAKKIHGTISFNVIEFQNNIGDMIDFETSEVENRVCIKRGVDKQLDELHETFDSLHAILYAVARRVQDTMDPRWRVELNVEYFPSLGFLARVVPLDEGFLSPRYWKLSFSADNVNFYRTPETDMLNDEFGDIDSDIQGRELELVQKLVEKMIVIDKEITIIMDVVAELDCLLALSRAVSIHSLARPNMVEQSILEIHRGRHLIQERWVERYISNDTLLEGGPEGKEHNMMIVTGANGSGKSAYGKQVALIVFMAQIGSFVPAESATIGVVDKLYTRIQTRESVSKDASAFMIDLAQVSLALRGVTERSLVILDEFGKGTNPADGAGLLAGVIEALINGVCPRTVVLTHFHELFTKNFIDDSLPILHCYMKTELAENTKKLEYLFRLTPGKCLTSNAAACALAHGLPARIVQRGIEVSELIGRCEITKLHDQGLTPQDVKELKEAEELAKRFLRWDIDPETQDVMIVLRDMVEACLDLEEAEDGSSEVELLDPPGQDQHGRAQDVLGDPGNGDHDRPIEVDQDAVVVKQEPRN